MWNSFYRGIPMDGPDRPSPEELRRQRQKQEREKKLNRARGIPESSSASQKELSPEEQRWRYLQQQQHILQQQLSSQVTPTPQILTMVPFGQGSIQPPQFIPLQHQQSRKIYFYLIHGHGGYLPKSTGEKLKINPKINVKFFASEGETTQHVEKRNPMASWTKLFFRLTGGSSLPDDFIVDCSKTHDNLINAHFVFGDPDIPSCGLYVCCYDRDGNSPNTATLLMKIPDDPLSLEIAIRYFIKDYKEKKTQNLTLCQDGFDVYWLCCRVELQERQNQ